MTVISPISQQFHCLQRHIKWIIKEMNSKLKACEHVCIWRACIFELWIPTHTHTYIHTMYVCM